MVIVVKETYKETGGWSIRDNERHGKRERQNGKDVEEKEG